MWYALDILIAIIIDWVIGDPYGFPHPVIYIGKLISKLQKFTRKRCKSSKALKFGGGFIVITVAFVTFIIPFLLLLVTREIPLLHHIINVFILWTTLACKCLGVEGKKIYLELEKDDLKEARVKLSYIVGRETKDLSEHEVIRADVETIAENTADGVIAPMFFAMLFGPFGGAGAMMYKGINTMDSMLGYLTEEFKHIGFFPAKVDDVFNYIPARITGLLIALSAPVVGGNVLKSFRIMVRDRHNHKSPNCAYPEAAAAGAMKVQLGGTNTYFGQVIYKPTMGDDVIALEKYHILQCIKLMYAAEILMYIIYFIIIILWRIIF
ncbi:adenosylcobinamide-phosphate synthase [Hathewaya proteolytica DSM 3090]|uniref:Cobalamin biosynthesis protein CobD n=1 Tax=Hathewaya proteolytica DSM 3090 TaxID=1121331 RepID=A0A1M6Q561_9CLOT|nr:adenosylcobinamide-phosphate synthase CbiB [Hathewaya proteolytica]SHK15290.1 adenosylcobinamide-phosphate synthase [Hathewaya proteolytica DSM 3090]